MRTRLVSHPVQSIADVRAFFDQAAEAYKESHGPAAKLLAYRVDILRRLLPSRPGGLLVELACGPGDHLSALAEGYDKALGLDLSPAMIARAETRRLKHSSRERIRFAVDAAEELATLNDGTVDAVFCVGALEHVLDRDAAVRQVHRVLKPGGTFACLTLNGGYIWYARIAPWLGYETRHLATDRFLNETEVRELLAGGGLRIDTFGHWSFIPRGDMPWVVGKLLGGLDRLGRLLRLSGLRGGICFRASKAGCEGRA
jgi:2-polyprenyl-6-hydroxyphenyl methylase/3-demethylubiquinone-9 3-methyltransferase